MVLAKKPLVSAEYNSVSKSLQMSRISNREVEISLHKQNDKISHQGFNDKCGNLEIDGTSASDDENYGEKYVDSNAIENSSPNEHPDATCKKARQAGDMTLEEMYNDQNLCDEEDDSDWDPLQKHVEIVKLYGFVQCLNLQIIFCFFLQQKVGQAKEMTLEDMYNDQNLCDDDDDSDWEPLPKHVEILKWFCTNCTMVNSDDVLHCDICGEHRRSGILKRGFLASPLLDEDEDVICVEQVIRENRVKDTVMQSLVSSSSTAIGFDERMLLHFEVQMKSHPHPERPERLRAIAASLAVAGIFPGKCYPMTAREITKEELKMVHSLEHIEVVELSSRMLSSYFTPDTYANEHSACAARLAAGLCADLASAIVSGKVKNGFALVRPPGHHAGVRQAMGFCLHNNAAIAALAAQVAGARKVLIVDWDVHHGNGTQEIFEQNKSVLYISLHRHEGGKFYPGTGAAGEVGTMGAEGYCVNVPWSRRGVGDNDYIFAFQHVVLPIASEFAPDITIISAGFDAARGDPLGCCDITPTGYAQMTQMLNVVSGGKLLVILEGGYNLRSISSSATAVIKVLLGESPEAESDTVLPSHAGLQTIMEVLKIQMNFWPILASTFTKLQSQWGMYLSEGKKKRTRKRRRVVAPIWWKWGRKCLLYYVLCGHFRGKRRVD